MTLSEHTKEFLKNKGVTCFSERNDDLLMWSHYGGRYKGFCMGFSTGYEPFSKIKKVTYTDTMPRINAVSVLLHGNSDQLLDLFCTKSQSWHYEEEWRCFHHHAGTLFGYKAKALESVYFGPDIDTQSLEIACLILAGQKPDVKLWKGRRSVDKFEVVFKEFTYINHLDAKRRGLIK